MLDAQILYRAKASKQDDGSHKFPRDFNIEIDDISLADSLEDDPQNYAVRKELGLGLPAGIDGQAATDPSLHYVRYQIKEGREGIDPPGTNGRFPKAPKHIKRRWQLSNQLGTIVVDSKRTTSMLVPAAMDPNDAPSAPDLRTHFECYGVAGAKGAPADQLTEDGKGRLRRDLQLFARDSLDDCVAFTDGTPSWPGTSVEGSCLFDIRAVKELCSPASVDNVDAGRETSASIDAVAADTPKALLCYSLKASQKILSDAAGALVGLSNGDRFPERRRQAKHLKRKKKDGTALQTQPGNSFPSPIEMDTLKADLLCLPTDILAVSVL